MAKKARYQKRRFQNTAGMIWASVVVMILVTVVAVKSISLGKKASEYQAREEALTVQIEAEQKRSEEIAEFEKYTHTRKYIEDTARDKLGLVYPDEIVFRSEDN